MSSKNTRTSVTAAVEAVERGYSPIPIHSHDKKPAGSAWTRGVGTSDPDEVRRIFTEHAEKQQENIGLLLGEPSNGLIDIDLDHPKTRRLKEYFLPPTSMKSGRAGRPGSHYWYLAEPGTLQGYRKFTMPKKDDGKVGDVIVEYRSTGGQSVIPPSVHPTGEYYRWEGQPWGGEDGPAVINGKVLQVQVATLALCTVLLDGWPTQGSRHEAYLALAGGLLWYGDREVHPFWEKNVGVIIEALAEATMDEDGADSRKAEVLRTTIQKIRDGRQTQGFGKLAEIIGDKHVKQARILIAEVESAAGYVARSADLVPDPAGNKDPDQALAEHASELAATPMEERDPLADRLHTWQTVDLDPYLAGRVRPVEPSILERTDPVTGEVVHLMYPGRVNMLYGSSESAKSWIALQVCLQVMSYGQRVMYLDLEDEPVNTLNRLMLLGAGPDDLRHPSFSYIRPEEPLASMQRNRWGKMEDTPQGRANQDMFEYQLDQIQPALIVADGMSVLYGLHGLNTNDTVDTDVITSWMKKLTRNGQTTVIVIDHTSKGAERGSMPIGSQHKVSMVQGSLLQVWPVKQPMPGALGKVELIVLKDRPGQVRAISQKSGTKAQLAAEVTMDSRDTSQVIMQIKPPADATKIARTGQMDFQRDLAAEKAENMRKAQNAILYDVFKGDDTVELSAMQIADRLSQVEGLAPTLAEMKKNANGQWGGHGARALKKLVQDDVYLDSIGATKDRRYRLRVRIEVPGNDFDLAPDSTVDLGAPSDDAKSRARREAEARGDFSSLSADAPLGAPMTNADDDD